MDLKILIDFAMYLEQNHQGFDSNQDQYDISLSSIFSLYASEFREYIESEGIADSFDSNNDGHLSNEEYTQFTEGLSVTQNGEISTEKTTDNTTLSTDTTATNSTGSQPLTSSVKPSFNFLEGVSNDLSDEDLNMMLTLFDTDKDGVLSTAEGNKAKSLLSKLDGKKDNLSADDLKTFKDYISGLDAAGLTSEEIIKKIMGLDGNHNNLSNEDFDNLAGLASMDIQTNSVMEAANAGDISTSSSAASQSTPHNPASAEKNIQNMSVEEVEQELETAKTATKEAYDAYMAELEKDNSEIADKLKEINTNIDSTQTELDTANNNLTDHTTTITNLNKSLSTSTGRLSEIDGSIATLEASKNNPEADEQAINAQISELENEKNTLQNETIPGLQKSIEETQAKIDELNKSIPVLEANLADLKTQATKCQDEEVNKLAETNQELKTKLDSYNQALQYQNTVEQTLETRKAAKVKAENVDMPSNDEGSKDLKDINASDSANLPMTYKLGDQEYKCVGFTGYDTDGDGTVDFKPDSWEEVQRYFANGGVANIGKYGTMQCHNYSNVMTDFVLGTVNKDLLNALIQETNDPNYGNQDTAGLYGSQREYNPRDCLQCKAKDRDEERAIIENELKNGRPCLVSVPYSGGCHWVTAVGIADNGDILIWDSYNGSMEKLGCSSNSDKTKLHRNMATANGVMVLVKGSSYQYGDPGYINYWEDAVGQTSEYTIAQNEAHKKKNR